MLRFESEKTICDKSHSHISSVVVVVSVDYFTLANFICNQLKQINFLEHSCFKVIEKPFTGQCDHVTLYAICFLSNNELFYSLIITNSYQQMLAAV